MADPTTAGDVIARIDAAIGCQHCTGPLGGSPSDDFCSAGCQAAWSAARTTPLQGDDEPTELAAHVVNQVELHSPETCPDCVGGRWCPDRPAATLVHRGRTIDLSNAFGGRASVAEQLHRDWPWVGAELWTAAVGEPPPADGSGTSWSPIGTITAGFEPASGPVPLAHYLADEDGTVHANRIVDDRRVTVGFDLPHGPLVFVDASGRHQLLGQPAAADPSSDVVAWTTRFAPSFEPTPWQIRLLAEIYAHGPMRRRVPDHAARAVAEWGRAINGFVDACRSAAEAAATLAGAMGDAPPTEPRARALWLRRNRNTGPQPARRRAPRAINPRRSR